MMVEIDDSIFNEFNDNDEEEFKTNDRNDEEELRQQDNATRYRDWKQGER